MPLASGTRFGPYEISAQIGQGGMGEVYRATDTNLKRAVAIKVLPESVAADVERLARFQREAEVLATLNHPNIAAIYGLERGAGTTALVMELVEGPTLADRIAQGAISVDEALAIARQIAEALEAAHERGIIHRDLKPANVKVRDDGTVKVLDFGLAKALSPAGATGDPRLQPGLSQAPTITTPARLGPGYGGQAMTQAGMILGTAAYMSPEQAKGREADKRCDVWAFGCVLFEMLTGRRVFEGEDVADTLAAVLRADPPWTLLPPDTPPAVRSLLRRCLERDVRRRVGDLSTARFVIEEAAGMAPAVPAAAQPDANARGAAGASQSRGRERLTWATVAILGLTVVGSVMALRDAPAAPELRVDITTPPTTAPESFALSPDGLQMAFVATSEGRPMLFVRSLRDGNTRVFANTEQANDPFWSPDSRSVGFLSQGNVKRLDLSDGSVRTISSGAGGGQGGSWGRDGSILFARNLVGPILRTSVMAAEEAAAVTSIGEQQSGHVFPWLLPDGRTFLYQARSGSAGGIHVGILDGSTDTRLADADLFPVAFVSGHLVFTRQGGLIAQAFDATTLALRGEPFRIVERSSTPEGTSGGFAVSASAAGSLAFRPLVPPARRLVWFDRSGKELSRIDDAGDFINPALSPDGRRLLLRRRVDGVSDIWILDLARGAWSPTSTSSSQAAWSPDGRRIGFHRARQGSNDLFVRSLETDRAGEEVVLATPELKGLHDWSPDGRFLLYQPESAAGIDVWAVPLEEPRTPIALAQTRFDERLPQVSPDGQWVAYESNESGRFEIYAQPFPGPGERVRISTTGGAQVRWRKDGRELFYVGLDEQLMAVPLRVTADGKLLEPGVASPLFVTRIPGGAEQPGGLRQQYVVSPDGQRFLVATLVDEAAAPPITLILNWAPGR